MSAADEAYDVAQRLIAEAKEEGSTRLDFDREDCRALDRLPPEIAGLDALRILELQNTHVSDLSYLAGLTALTILRLDDTQVSDLSPLAGLTALTALRLDHTPVSDLSPLAGLTGMTELWLNNTQVSDLFPLTGLTALTALRLDHTPVSDLSPLAGLTGMTTLWLINTQVSDLSPLVAMTGMTTLILTNTQVSDLSPLAGMTGIRALGLDNTAALDLRVLRNLKSLAESHENIFGLQFLGTAATRADARIAEIARIMYNDERARVLFDYLEGWLPPDGPGQGQPPPDDLFPILSADGRLEVAQSLPTEAERDERLKLLLHDRMRTKTRELAQAAGNRFPRLAARARAVLAQVDRPFANVDLVLLHLEVEDLSARERAGTEDDDPFPPEVTGPLSDVLRIGPGLTLGHPDVELLNERINRARGQPVPAAEKAAQDAMSRVTAADVAAIGDGLHALESRMDQLPAEVAIVVQRAAHRNMLWRIATGGLIFSAGLAEGVGVNVVSTLFHNQIVAFVQTNWPILTQVAGTYGSAFAEWFAISVGSVPDLATLSRDTLDRLRSGRKST